MDAKYKKNGSSLMLFEKKNLHYKPSSTITTQFAIFFFNKNVHIFRIFILMTLNRNAHESGDSGPSFEL